jgi:hypothetical protein
MATLAEMKALSPAYAALSDQEFADKIYQTHYAGKIDRAEFDKRTRPISMTEEVVGGFSGGFNKGVDALINLPGTVMNLGAKALGYEAPFEPVSVASRFNVAPEPRTATGRISEAIGEVTGSSVIPQAGLLAKGARAAPLATQGGNALSRGVNELAARAAANPKAFATMEGVSNVGAGTGVGVAREDNAGPMAEFGAGILGGLAAPATYGALARTGAGIKSGVKYGTNMVARARNPQLAADQDVADALTKGSIAADDIRAELAPKISPQLAQRGLTDADAADIVSRAAAKEPVATIAADYNLHPSTVQRYVSEHREMTPTPRNIIDVAKDVAGEGMARPVTRLGRAAYGLADDAETTQALTSRQETQSGRSVEIINRASGGRDYDAEVANLTDILENQKNAAYAAAKQNERPFDLFPALRAARDRAFKSAGNIKAQLEKAIDLFYEPEMQASTGTVRKLGKPIADVERFQNAREALDDMITNSKTALGESTKLTARLEELRKTVNNVMRNANPDYAAADDLFSGAKSTQNLLKQGEDLTTKLGAKADRVLAGFGKLKPEQQDVVRLGFLRKLSNMASNPRDGAGVANQFQSPAVRQIIRKMFSNNKALTAKENRAIRERGETLIKQLREEATTTKTLNEVTGRGNSPSAPWSQDMNKFLAGAKAGADVITGRWGAVLENLSNRLTYQIGEKQATAIMQTLTETDPARLLPTLNRLARQAKTTKERMEYVAAIRKMRRGYTRGVIGSGIVSADQR